ncbi:MAG: S-layer homology domain-containing protein, partial [Thermoanaerobaculia bacterium]
PGGGISNGQTFTIENYPVPVTTGISPSFAIAGGPDFTLTVNGVSFFPTSVVRWNDSDRTTTYVSESQLAASIPASDIAAVGTATIRVFNPAPGGGLSNGQTFDINQTFLDVPPSYWAYAYIEAIVSAGITSGCGGGNYCPESFVSRAQMAVFLLRAEHGGSYLPPACTGIFQDVACMPAPAFAVDWIEQLSIEGITAGCGGGNYCPGEPVTRAQMAVFLLRAEHGSSYMPPACSGIFQDVACMPTPAFAVDWIEGLSAEGVTGGCSASPPLYCPDDPSTRAQMAVFLVTAFNLPLP